MSTSDKAEDSLTRVEEIAEQNATCCICENYLSSRIFQCLAGHWFCESCALRIDTCPTCRGSIPRGGVRNRFAELILGGCTLTCSEPGCGKSFPFNELATHYDRCEYRRIVCPRDGCGWCGTVGDITEHIESEHAEDIYTIADSVTINLTNTNSLVIDAGGEVFLRTHANQLFMFGAYMIRGHSCPHSIVFVIMYIGGRAAGIKALTSVSTDQDDVELSVERAPWCLIDDISDARKSRRNLVIENDLALRMGSVAPSFKYNDQLQRHPINDSLNLPVVVKISKNDDGPVQLGCNSISVNLETLAYTPDF